MRATISLPNCTAQLVRAEGIVIHGLGAGQAGLGELGFSVEHVEVLAYAVAVAALGAVEGIGGLGYLLHCVVVARLAELHVVGGLAHVGANLLLRILSFGLGGAVVGGGFYALLLVLMGTDNWATPTVLKRMSVMATLGRM